VIKYKTRVKTSPTKYRQKKRPLLIKKTAFAANVADFGTAIKCTAQKLPHKTLKKVKPPGTARRLYYKKRLF